MTPCEEYMVKFKTLPLEDQKRHIAIVVKYLLAVLKPMVEQSHNDLSALAKGAIDCDYELGDGIAA